MFEMSVVLSDNREHAPRRRYYGLTIWFPEYVKKLEQEAFNSQRLVESGILQKNLVYK